MSVVALSDLLFGDLLTETNMKPWWEKVRGYLLASSMAFALSATYLTLNGVPVNCLPAETGNMSVTFNFNTLQGAWTNTYCSNNMPWYFSFLGPMCLAAALFNLIASSYWLHIPAVIDSFLTFCNMEKIISDSDMTLEEMKNFFCQPVENHAKTDKQSKLRKVCVALWEGELSIKLRNVYRMRNCILIVLSVISGSLFSFTAYRMISHGDRFRCNIASDEVGFMNDIQRFPESFICVTSMVYRLIIFNIVFLILVFAQIVPILLGMRKSRKTICPLPSFENVALMKDFWMYGRPSRSETFSGFIDHVCGPSAISDIDEKLCEAIMIEDHELIRCYLRLTEGDGYLPREKFIMNRISELYKSKLEGKFPNNAEEFRKIENAIVATIDKHVGISTMGNYGQILKKASADRRWKLFAEILEAYICKFSSERHGRDSRYLLLTDLNVEYDIFDDDRCSIMHYFLDKLGLLIIAEMVAKQHEDMGFKLYAHSRGKSSLVGTEIAIEIYAIHLPEGTTNHSPPSGQIKMKKYYNDFREISDPPDASAIEELNRGLSLIKFREFDDDIKNFAKVARSNPMLWPTFFTILNCYIIPENAEEEIVPLPREGTDSYSLWNTFISSPLQKPFVSTAAKYILTCLTTGERVKAIKGLKGRRDLKDSDREELLQFIDKSCNNETPNDAHKSDENTLNLSVATTDNATSSISSGQSTTIPEESCAIDMEKEPLIRFLQNRSFQESSRQQAATI